MLSQSPAMAEDNMEYDLLEDVGEELDYEDFTLEDEDLGVCHPSLTGTCTFAAHSVLFDSSFSVQMTSHLWTMKLSQQRILSQVVHS